MNDDPTRRIHRDSAGGHSSYDDPTRIIRRGGEGGARQPDDETVVYEDTEDMPTMEVTQPGREMTAGRAASGEDEATVLFRPSSKNKGARSEGQADAGDAGASASRPVVGWVVVVGGPGAGNSHVIGHGINQIGRDAGQHIALSYGDNGISRQSHAALTYDAKGRMFYIQQGSGSALAYLDGKPVLQPVELSAGSKITLGDTTLAFVPFCGADFDWADAL